MVELSVRIEAKNEPPSLPQQVKTAAAVSLMRIESGSDTLEFECHGEGVPYVHRVTVHLAGDECGK